MLDLHLSLSEDAYLISKKKKKKKKKIVCVYIYIYIYIYNWIEPVMHDVSFSVMVNELFEQTNTNEFDSHWVPYVYGEMK